MHHFHYQGDEMYCEDVPLRRLADEMGTPLYVYSHATLTRHFRVFSEAFAGARHLICFSMKSNANLAIIALFVARGGGVDIVSGGELYRALRAGCPPERIVYAGVGKTREEIDAALKAGILMFNVESEQELEAISARAIALGTTAPVALRVNPDVDPQTHPYVATGLKKSKFGIDIGRSVAAYERAGRLPGVRTVGVDCHIGSQLTDVRPFVDAVRRVRDLVFALRARGMRVEYLDLGGGLGITYDTETPPLPAEYAARILDVVGDLDVTLILEPGRVIAGNAGVLVSRVLYLKETEVKQFVIVDAGMNDLIRPSLYGAYQAILPVRQGEKARRVVDVVGPICESGDFLAKDRDLPLLKPGDLVAVMSAGAYGFSMASNYNARRRPPELLVHGATYSVIRQRETYEDLIRGEVIPDVVGASA